LAEGHLTRRLFGEMLEHLGAARADGVITTPCTQSAATKKRRKTGAVSKKSRNLVSVRRGSSRYCLLPGAHDQEDENGCSTGWRRVYDAAEIRRSNLKMSAQL